MKPILRGGCRYLSHTGVETDLIFNRGIDLPNFSLFPKLETEEGRALLRSYAEAQISIAAENGLGAMLETATWMANADRAAPLGYDSMALDRVNRAAAALLADLRETSCAHVLISGQVGPRDDAYAPAEQMDPETARAYHAPQIRSLAQAGADMVGGFTLAYVSEAAGIAAAAREAGIPVAISFTVETDGNLPDGTALADAIRTCDRLTDACPAYYLLNCAHPEHFEKVLYEAVGTGRFKGMVVNASRCSHAELDAAEELDAGNPPELGGQLKDIARAHPSLQVFGGCCGTDARHLREIARSLAAA